ncbi:MAG: hypothetical protein L0956_05470 [Candidatus Mariimomonas ferrooxydans]
MDTLKKRAPGMKKAFSFTIILLILLVVFSFFFLKSPSFPKLVEYIIKTSIQRPVEIGSLSFANGRELIIRDLVIKEAGEKEGSLISLPYLKIGFSLSGLLRGRVHEVIVKKPKFFLDLKIKRGPASGMGRLSLPFRFKKGSLTDGEVVFKNETGTFFHINSVNILLEEADSGKYSAMQVTAFIPELDSEISVDASGAYSFRTDCIEIESFIAQVAGLGSLTLRGAINRVSSANPDFNLKAEAKEISLHEIKRLIGGSAFTLPDSIDINGNGRADLSITGDFKSPEIKGSVYVKGKSLKGDTVELKTFEAGLPLLEYSRSKGFSGSFNLNAGSTVIYRSGRQYIKEEDISFKGELEASADSRLFRLKDISLESGSIKGVTGNVTVALSKPIIINTSVEMKGIDIGNIWAKLSDKFKKSRGYTVKGESEIISAFKITVPENESPKVTGNADIRITEGGFSSHDATTIGEGIDLRASVSIKSSLPLGSAEFTVNAQASSFELLMGRFYGDFSDRSLKLSAKGSYTGSDDTLNVSFLKLDLADMGHMHLSGEVSGLKETPDFNTEISLVDLSNSRAYNFFIRETFKLQYPFLSQLEIGGITSLKLFLDGTADRFNVRGNIRVRDMDIVNKNSGLAVKGIQIALPVDATYPEVSGSREKAHFGSFRIRDISWEEFNLKNMKFFPLIRQNALVFKEDINIPVFGGNAVLKDVVYKDLLSPQRKLTLTIAMDSIDLAQISDALKIPRFNGHLSGVIPHASIVNSTLLTDGEISMKLFGGEMKVRDFSVNNVFGPVPVLKASLEIEDIDLSKLTETFEFGHISGILQGYVNNLVVANGQAESFEALIETVKSKGISQRISVEAIKKISILSSGSSVSALNTGIYRFFKEYRYEKIGFKGSLRNDNFLLLGAETEGNRHYIVKGGLLPPRVEVISYTQNISFQEIVKRLKRIKSLEKKTE